MKKLPYGLILSAILLLTNPLTTMAQQSMPPKAAKKPFTITAHGHERVDDYYWLRERENPEVIAYLEAENAYTEASTSSWKPLQEKIYQEIVDRIVQKDESVPYSREGYFFYNRYEEGKEYPIYCRKKGSLEAPEEILLDVNVLAEGLDFCAVDGLTISDDGKILAYFIDTVGRRQYVVRFKDLSTGVLLPDEVPNATSFAWSADNQHYFVGTQDTETLRGDKIWRNKLGQDFAKASLVFDEKDATFNVRVGRGASKEYIYISTSTTLSSETRYLPANQPLGEFKVFLPREEKHEYAVADVAGEFYIHTNWQAENFRIMKASEADSQNKNAWKEVIAHNPDILIEGLKVFKDYLVLSVRKDGFTKLEIRPWDTQKTPHYIDMGEEACTIYRGTNFDFDTEVLRIGYTSMTTPSSVYDYNMRTREKTLLKQQQVLGGFDASAYASEVLYAKAADGTSIPISIVYKKGMMRNGQNPVLLYGYGSYGASMDPGFGLSRLSLLDRGFIFAIAHIRGGSEMGRQWYENGKMFKKINTFTDFIACAEHLIAEELTNPQRLFAEGGSAGGLLMGAIINMRPDLFKGVIAAVPFVDVVTTMLDETIPLTTFEYDEWGNPNNKDSYEYMLSYSPYDQVSAKNYPNLLVTTGLHDSQVQYWEPAKWVAKLRELKTDQNLLLLKTDMSAGHSGKTGRFKYYEDTAFDYTFLLHLAGIKE
ncbi:S9 family peptidase [Eisenibacter elegans]|uniref:S9 family peptidase n=1 Tax=Eisenibacter elegans TaxID=997 RepID=UPI0004113AA8|nr:oligopeptidase B [Eisenibacter elegans]